MLKIFLSILIVSFSFADSQTKLDKKQILDILKESAKTLVKKHKQSTVHHARKKKKSPARKKKKKRSSSVKRKIAVKSQKDALVMSGLILPKSRMIREAKEKEAKIEKEKVKTVVVKKRKPLPFGSLPNITMNENDIRDLSFSERFNRVSQSQKIVKKQNSGRSSLNYTQFY